MACLGIILLQRFKWQHEIRAVAQVIKECVDAHDDLGTQNQA